MGLRDIARSLRPGNDRELAAELARKAARKHREAIKAMSDREAQRTADERRESAARGRRHKQELARRGSGARLI